jgi:hypothetical protein
VIRPEVPHPAEAEVRRYASPKAAWDALVRETAKPVLNNVAFGDMQGGVLILATRSGMWKSAAETTLSSLDLNRWFPTFKQFQIRLDANTGQTKREQLSELELSRRKTAQAAAKDSPAVKLLQDLMKAWLDIDDVRPPAENAPSVTEAEVEETAPTE